MTIVGLVPARSGSKGIPQKNLAMCAGKSLLGWTAGAALASRVLDRVILSTDDTEIAEAGRAVGLETPFLRPAELSGDQTTMLEVIAHAIFSLRSSVATIDAIVLLQPTSPLRRAGHIVEAVDLFKTIRAATLVSVTRVPHRFVPSSLMRQNGNRLVPYEGNDVGPTLRQEKAKLFARNGPAVLIVRPEVVESGTLYGDPTIGYEMNEIDSIDIDTPEDLHLAEIMIKSRA